MSRFAISAIVMATAVGLLAAFHPLKWGVIAFVVMLIFVALMTAGVCSVRMQWFVRGMCRIHTNKHVIALTFDDGPDPVCTPRLLDWLEASGIHATFFCIGQKVERYPELAHRIIDQGHVIGNHTHRHSVWNNLMPGGVLYKELEHAQRAIEQAIGERPRLYRPPFGLTNPHLGRVLRRHELKLVGWTIRSFDTLGRPAEKVATRIVRRLIPGAIILLHDGCGDPDRLLDILRRVVDEARTKGYTFDSLDKSDSIHSA